MNFNNFNIIAPGCVWDKALTFWVDGQYIFRRWDGYGK
jgi:hypothetical protein